MHAHDCMDKHSPMNTTHSLVCALAECMAPFLSFENHLESFRAFSNLVLTRACIPYTKHSSVVTRACIPYTKHSSVITRANPSSLVHKYVSKPHIWHNAHTYTHTYTHMHTYLSLGSDTKRNSNPNLGSWYVGGARNRRALHQNSLENLPRVTQARRVIYLTHQGH